MNLIVEPLDLILDLQVLLVLVHIILAFIFGRKHHDRDGHFWRIVGIDHSRVTCCCCLEDSVLLGDEVDDLARVSVQLAKKISGTYLSTPAISEDTPVLNVRILVLELLHHLAKPFNGFRWRGGRLEKLTELLALLIGVRRVPRNVCWLAFEEIWHKDLMFEGAVAVFITGKDVGTLECLWEETENVVNDKDASGRFGTGCV